MENLVFGFVNVKDVDDCLEVAQYFVVSAHVRRHDAADDVLAQAAELLRGEVVERVGPRVVEQVEAVRAVMVLQRSHVVVAMSQRSPGADLHPTRDNTASAVSIARSSLLSKH